MKTRKLIPSIPLLFLLAGNWPPAFPAVGEAAAPALSAELEELISNVEEKVIAWRRDIHQHPELGNREFRTAGLVAGHLGSLGLEVQTGVAHTGVVGLLRGGLPGPVVALRADMDALPITERVDLPFASKATALFNGEEVGVMHACGHDAHVAILMGVAEVLAAVREQIPGAIKFIFQPAEEGPPEGEDGGAKMMVEEGVLTEPDVEAAFALHISSHGEVGNLFFTPGGTYASADDFRIVVKGRQTHGAAPWDGIDPIVASAHIITALQTIVSRQVKLTHNPAVVTIGKIQGGVRSNIIPEEVEMIGTVRALSADDRLAMHEALRRITTSVAEGLGATAEITLPLSMSYPVTYNDPRLTEMMVPVLRAVAGADRVQERPPRTGAEDFAYFAQVVPGFYIGLGGRPSHVPIEEAPAHHTPDFYIDDSGLNLGVRAMSAMALHYLHAHRRDADSD